MTLFTILVYGTGAIAIALLLLRMFMRKRRERRAAELANPARVAVRREAAADPVPPSPATVEVSPLRMPVEPPVFAAARGGAVAMAAPGQPSLFKTLGKKRSSSADTLPVIEAGETPLANS